MTGTPVIKKVPGNLVKFNHEKDGYVDLTKLSKTELLDLNQREANLLKNKKFLEKLPDKGQRIKTLSEKILREIKKRDDHEKLCGLLANLNVSESKSTIDKLEWTGKYDVDSSVGDAIEEDEVNPLKILATHSGTTASKEKSVRMEAAESLINKSDVEKCDPEFENIEHYAKDLCHRFDSVKIKEKQNRFYAHKSLNATSVKELIKDVKPEIVSSKSSSISANKVQMLSLQESVVIQQQQMKHLKEIEMKHALEKLMHKTSFGIIIPEANTSEYRDITADSDDEVSSASASGDDDEKDTIVYYDLVD